MAKVANIEPDPDPHTLGLGSWHFIKSSRSVIGPDDGIEIPNGSRKLDWEVELAAVIGHKTKNISVEDALSCVAGYTIANDLSARDFSRRNGIALHSPFRFDWVSHKSFDTSCPLGPWITPAAQIKDPQNLAISLSVNGELKQNSNTSQMIFSIAEQISGPVEETDALAGRRDPDRYAGRCRQRLWPIPEIGRPGFSENRRHRRAE